MWKTSRWHHQQGIASLEAIENGIVVAGEDPEAGRAVLLVELGKLRVRLRRVPALRSDVHDEHEAVLVLAQGDGAVVDVLDGDVMKAPQAARGCDFGGFLALPG